VIQQQQQQQQQGGLYHNDGEQQVESILSSSTAPDAQSKRAATTTRIRRSAVRLTKQRKQAQEAEELERDIEHQNQQIDQAINKSLQQTGTRLRQQMTDTDASQVRYLQLARMLLLPVSASSSTADASSTTSALSEATTIDEYLSLEPGSIEQSIKSQSLPAQLDALPDEGVLYNMMLSFSQQHRTLEVIRTMEWINAMGYAPTVSQLIVVLGACRNRKFFDQAQHFYALLLEQVSPLIAAAPPPSMHELAHGMSHSIAPRKNQILQQIDQLARPYTIMAERNERSKALMGVEQRARQQVLDEQSASAIKSLLHATSSMIQCYTRVGQVDQAFALVRDSLVRKGIMPDVVVFTTLIDGCLHNRRADDAFEVFDLMRERFVQPDVDAFNHIIEVCALAKKVCRPSQSLTTTDWL
jgi:pentatricopeptide repeat protein